MGGRSPSATRRFLPRHSAPASRDPLVPWHAMSVAEVFGRLRASSDGLSEEEAASRLEAVGRNALPESKRTGPLPLVADLLLSPFVLILLGAAALSLVVQNYLSAF